MKKMSGIKRFDKRMKSSRFIRPFERESEKRDEERRLNISAKSKFFLK